MSGNWIFVCGPSGAGKDSVIASAQQRLAQRKDILFARRVVTRPVQPGSDHDALTEQDFLGLLEGGGLRWHWQAHGFYYGIEERYAADVQAGSRVVVNGSRAHFLGLAPSPTIRMVQITTQPQELAIRLAQRGRDSPSAVSARLHRNALFADIKADYEIVNDASLAIAGQCLADYLTDDSSR